jgi:hypothetical protein
MVDEMNDESINPCSMWSSLSSSSSSIGVACLIHYAKMNVSNAIAAAKQLRPIIDPIGQLPEFLHRYVGR